MGDGIDDIRQALDSDIGNARVTVERGPVRTDANPRPRDLSINLERRTPSGINRTGMDVGIGSSAGAIPDPRTVRFRAEVVRGGRVYGSFAGAGAGVDGGVDRGGVPAEAWAVGGVLLRESFLALCLSVLLALVVALLLAWHPLVRLDAPAPDAD